MRFLRYFLALNMSKFLAPFGTRRASPSIAWMSRGSRRGVFRSARLAAGTGQPAQGGRHVPKSGYTRRLPESSVGNGHAPRTAGPPAPANGPPATAWYG